MFHIFLSLTSELYFLLLCLHLRCCINSQISLSLVVSFLLPYLSLTQHSSNRHATHSLFPCKSVVLAPWRTVFSSSISTGAFYLPVWRLSAFSERCPLSIWRCRNGGLNIFLVVSLCSTEN